MHNRFHAIPIVAEIGINHQGNLETAFKLIDMAAECGAHFVKFQKRSPEVSTPSDQWNIPKIPPWGDTPLPYIEYRRRMEFSRAQFNQIRLYCRARGIRWFGSAWDMPSAEFLSQFKNSFIKIPSAKITDLDLLKKVSQLSRQTPGCMPMFSTGMSSSDEIDRALRTILKETADVCLMHCNSAYPTDDSETNLSLIEEYAKRPGVIVGFSSHSVSPFPAVYAAAWGARIIEVHITLDRSMQGSDHAASLEKAGLLLLTREVKRLGSLYGDGVKRVYDSELPARKRLRGY